MPFHMGWLLGWGARRVGPGFEEVTMNGGGTEVQRKERSSLYPTRVPPRPLEWTSRTHLGRIMKPPCASVDSSVQWA